MRRFIAIVLLVLVAIPAGVRGEDIRVAAAISLKESVEAIAGAFKDKTGNSVQFSFGASGALVAQIKNGGNTDVFLSAANEQMDELAAAKLIDPGTRVIIATNALALIVPRGSNHVPGDFAALTDSIYQRIALGEPTTVPAGRYARDVLDRLHLYDVLKDRLIYGANVRQVLVYVERGEADAGIVYTTDAKAAGDGVQVAAIADPATHRPIEYPAALLVASTHKAVARQFLSFLGTPEAQKIFAANGFGTPKGSPAP